MKNTILRTVLMTMILFLGVVIGATTTHQTQAQETKKDFTQDNQGRTQIYNPRGNEFKIIETSYKENGDIVETYNNGSWSVRNYKTNEFYFQPVETGDFIITLKDEKELNGLIETYKSIYLDGYF